MNGGSGGSGNGGGGSGAVKMPTDFLKSIRGRPVVVKLNSGADYRGRPSSPALGFLCQSRLLDSFVLDLDQNNCQMPTVVDADDDCVWNRNLKKKRKQSLRDV